MRVLLAVLTLLAAAASSAARAGEPADPRPDLTLSGEIGIRDLHHYVEVPFTTPAGVDRITVVFAQDGAAQRTAIDLGLFDPERLPRLERRRQGPLHPVCPRRHPLLPAGPADPRPLDAVAWRAEHPPGQGGGLCRQHPFRPRRGDRGVELFRRSRWRWARAGIAATCTCTPATATAPWRRKRRPTRARPGLSHRRGGRRQGRRLHRRHRPQRRLPPPCAARTAALFRQAAADPGRRGDHLPRPCRRAGRHRLRRVPAFQPAPAPRRATCRTRSSASTASSRSTIRPCRRTNCAWAAAGRADRRPRVASVEVVNGGTALTAGRAEGLLPAALLGGAAERGLPSHRHRRQRQPQRHPASGCGRDRHPHDGGLRPGSLRARSPGGDQGRSRLHRRAGLQGPHARLRAPERRRRRHDGRRGRARARRFGRAPGPRHGFDWRPHRVGL